MNIKRMKSSELEGLRVRNIFEIKNGWATFPKGTLFTVVDAKRGVNLVTDKCPCHGVSLSINCPREVLEVVDEQKENNINILKAVADVHANTEIIKNQVKIIEDWAIEKGYLDIKADDRILKLNHFFLEMSDIELGLISEAYFKNIFAEIEEF